MVLPDRISKHDKATDFIGNRLPDLGIAGTELPYSAIVPLNPDVPSYTCHCAGAKEHVT